MTACTISWSAFVTTKVKLLLLSLLCATLCGCAYSRPYIVVTTIDTNGVTTVSQLRLTLFAVWPATQTMEKQRGSIGKTMSLGTVGADQETGGTNMVEALKHIDSILSKFRP